MITRRNSMMDPSIPLPDINDDMNESELECSEESPLAQNQMTTTDNSCGTQRIITPSELVEIINNPEAHGYSRLLILDARFEYEYRGGRIVGAQNITSRSQLFNVYNKYKGQNVCIVFHCEYSQNRGPKLYQIFREHDRHCNEYPALTYPNIFLLEGGYRRFYQEMPQFCMGGYIPMRDQRFVSNGELRRSHSFFKKDLLQQNRALRPRARIQRCSSQTCEHFPFLFETPSSLPDSGNCDDSLSNFPLSSSQGSF